MVFVPPVVVGLVSLLTALFRRDTRRLRLRQPEAVLLGAVGCAVVYGGLVVA